MQPVASQILAARALRGRLQADPHRPRYHLIPPEGWFNDANGALYWNGRYHLFYLARTPIPDAENSGGERWVEVWDHASSANLIHWTYHRPALEPETDGSTPLGIWSGGAVAGAPRPTLIYHVPGQGTCIAVSDDPMLEHWTPLPENPVIPITDSEEYTVFDPCAWKESDGYYALVGNRNRRPGFEGDSTSLFRSPDLRSWEYVGPFYASRRAWTDVIEDAACPDFFPLGDRHMLLMHGHRPYFQCHYYLGRYVDHRFDPEEHGRMNWPGGQISGPETLRDDQGRRIFFGWVMEAESESGERDWRQAGWASVMSLPRLIG
ncbi:MAG TPA: glycoside hydrolase family 32 protein, partial [Spirochaetia bacterium]|nr:glycoside hydrolase family 32 protein [Spirochaetia bacterium]